MKAAQSLSWQALYLPDVAVSIMAPIFLIVNVIWVGFIEFRFASNYLKSRKPGFGLPFSTQLRTWQQITFEWSSTSKNEKIMTFPWWIGWMFLLAKINQENYRSHFIVLKHDRTDVIMRRCYLDKAQISW